MQWGELMKHYIRISFILLCSSPLRAASFTEAEAAFTASQRDQLTTTFAQYLTVTCNDENRPPFPVRSTLNHATIINATLIVLKNRAYPIVDSQTINEIFPNQQTDSNARLLIYALDGICLAWHAMLTMPTGIVSSTIPQDEIAINYEWAMNRAATLKTQRGNTYLTQCIQKYLKAMRYTTD